MDEYRGVLELDPGLAEAANNLALALLRVGRAAEAIPVLRRALDARPAHGPCWNQLVRTLGMSGDVPGARAAAEEARARGVELAPDLLRALGQ
jgi:predicted Zn-dependent protease